MKYSVATAFFWALSTLLIVSKPLAKYSCCVYLLCTSEYLNNIELTHWPPLQFVSMQNASSSSVSTAVSTAVTSSTVAVRAKNLRGLEDWWDVEDEEEEADNDEEDEDDDSPDSVDSLDSGDSVDSSDSSDSGDSGDSGDSEDGSNFLNSTASFNLAQSSSGFIASPLPAVFILLAATVFV